MIRNQWYAILTSKEVKNKPVGIKRLSMDIVLFRDKDGNVHGFYDQCSHRGAKLSKGKIVGDCIQCPFHGIQFNPQGICETIPANGRSSTEDYERFNLKKLILKEVYGIIFLWWGEDEPGEIRFFEELLDKNYSDAEIYDPWSTHYSRVIENQLDVIHLPFVHHNTIGRGNRTLVNGPSINWEDDNTLIFSPNNEVDRGQKPKKPSETKPGRTYLKFIFPNMWVNFITDKVKILALFVPVDEENTMLIIRLYNRLTGIKVIDGFIAWASKLFNLIVERQDRRVVITQRPKTTKLKMGENLVQGDLPIIEYRRRREELKEKR